MRAWINRVRVRPDRVRVRPDRVRVRPDRVRVRPDRVRGCRKRVRERFPAVRTALGQAHLASERMRVAFRDMSVAPWGAHLEGGGVDADPRVPRLPHGAANAAPGPRDTPQIGRYNVTNRSSRRYATAAIVAAAGIVSTHAHRIRRASPQRTAERRLVAPTPTIAPVIVCVVLTGIPRLDADRMTMAPPVSAQKPLTGRSFVMREPIVLMMRHPPKSVPSEIDVKAQSLTHAGMCSTLST